MRISKWLMMALALMLCAALAAGCADKEGKNDKNNGADDGTNVSEQDNQGEDGSEQPQSDDDQDRNQNEDDTDVVNGYNGLIASGASSAEMLQYITDNYTKVKPETLTTMLVELERSQHDQSLVLEERYYTEAGVQEKLMDLYAAADFTMPSLDQIEDETLKKLLQDTEAAGYKPETAEGSFFPVIDYERYREFQSHVTADMKAYIDIMALESNKPAVKDAGLIIKWSEVVERARSMEKFLKDYPDSVKQEDMQGLFNGYKYISFYGIDNAPLFSYTDKTIVPEVKEAYLQALEGGTKDSAYLQTMQEFLDVVERNGGKQTEEVQTFQEKTTSGLLD